MLFLEEVRLQRNERSSVYTLPAWVLYVNSIYLLANIDKDIKRHKVFYGGSAVGQAAELPSNTLYL